MYTINIFKIIYGTRAFQNTIVHIPSSTTTQVMHISRWDHKLKNLKETDYYVRVLKSATTFFSFNLRQKPVYNVFLRSY